MIRTAMARFLIVVLFVVILIALPVGALVLASSHSALAFTAPRQ
jgi:hypothetical protein